MLSLALLFLIISGCSNKRENHNSTINHAHMDGYIFFHEDKDFPSIIFLPEKSGIESEELNHLSILEITEKYSDYYYIFGSKKYFHLPSNIKSRDKVTIYYDRILESYPPKIPVLTIEKAD